MYILYLCVYIRDIYLRAVCSAAGTLLILGELAVYIYTYTCLSMSMYGLWPLFLYEVFEHVCSLQQYSPQPRETESLLVTQSLWVAGMIKFIEKKNQTRKQGKNPESRFCGEASETCAQSIRSTARRVERICGRESEKERQIFTGHLTEEGGRACLGGRVKRSAGRKANRPKI